jgi:hypothetical protein
MRVFDVVFGYSPVEFYDGAFGFYGFLEEVAGAVVEICRGDQQAHAEQRDDIFDESQCFHPDSPAIFLKSGSPAPASRRGSHIILIYPEFGRGHRRRTGCGSRW